MERIKTLLVVVSIPFVVGCITPSATQEQRPKPDINKQFKGQVDVNKWIGIFEGESRELFKYRNQITDTLGLRPGMSVADIGAGTGFYTFIFAERVGPSGRAYAVDIAPDFLRHIDTQAQQRGLKNIRTLRSTQGSARLPTASIDLAFICDVYHHFEHPHRMMRSIRRALKPGGVLVVIDFIRIEGISSEWVLNHVRAGQEEISREIVSDGFTILPDVPKTPYLKESYLIRFRK